MGHNHKHQSSHAEKYVMVIDIDKCTGCGACAIACSQENNIPVRTDETDKYLSLNWLVIYRITNGKPFPKTKVAYIPRPCMHCDHPICVHVCPASATDKDAKGVVSQIYPRCFGCRYCMAACPYHARVFNWWDPKYPEGTERGFNPDVSTRMRGVVEKCNFCNHRYQRARDKAITEGRVILKEGEYVPACVEACPTKAMYFGNIKDPESKVAKLIKSPYAFRLLEKYGTHPSVYYLSKHEWVKRQTDWYLETQNKKQSHE
ncbi:MAG: 4Fe-4S dicluster domain-containing protein [Candidatus Desulfofervidus sp.]|nr:4Fe-4S dicluster domain-containing protein [Candidatus Desulfofervidus sp.]